MRKKYVADRVRQLLALFLGYGACLLPVTLSSSLFLGRELENPPFHRIESLDVFNLPLVCSSPTEAHG
jgi:hypothetical protein